MIFTTHAKQSMSQMKPVQRLPANTFLNKFVQQTQSGMRKEANTVSPSHPPTPSDPTKKPMKWGEPTWFLFHTLAEKIKPEYFNQHKNEIFEMIKTICSTLPCPTCANHATEYMKKIYFQNIRSKEDLQMMLWAFHNEVNTRKGVALFPIENVNTKYATANTRHIIQHFIHHHQDKHASFRMIADDLNRKRVCANLRTWFIGHIHIFEE